MYRGSSLVLGCIVSISLGASAFAGALSSVSGVGGGVSNAAASAVGTATSTATGAVAGVAGTTTGAVTGVAGAAGSAVSGATSAVAGAVGDAAGAVGSVAGTAAGAVGTATGAVNGVVGTAANAVGEAVAPSAAAAAALSKSDPQQMDAQWVSKDLLKFRGSLLKFQAQQVTIVKRDRPQAGGTLPVSSELVVDSCTRFLEQFQVLQSFSRAALFKNCPDIARQNGAETAGQ